jgi:hypothetical protein
VETLAQSYFDVSSIPHSVDFLHIIGTVSNLLVRRKFFRSAGANLGSVSQRFEC